MSNVAEIVAVIIQRYLMGWYLDIIAIMIVVIIIWQILDIQDGASIGMSRE